MNGPEEEMIDVALIVDSMVCEVTSATVKSYDERKMEITLTERGLENAIRSINLQKYDENAKEYLEGLKKND